MGCSMSMSIEKFYGDGAYTSLSADGPIYLGKGRAQSFTFTSPSLALQLPDARDFNHAGGPVFIIFNVGANAFDLEDNAGGVVGSIAAGFMTPVLLSNNSTQAGVWHIDTTAFTSPTSTTPPSFVTASRTGAPA